jgi:Pentapeptide repeats (8 copies)
MLKDCWAWLAEISKNEIFRSGLLVFALAVAAVFVLVQLERRWEKIPKKKRILQFFIAVLVITVVLPKPSLWPQGWGIGPEKSTSSVSVETVEKDVQGKLTKTVTTTKHDDGKTLWDWLSVLGVPLSLVILGYWLQMLQQSRAEALAKEEVLQGYFDRLSVLLVDKNLLAIAAQSAQTKDEDPLLASSKNVIRARTLSILRRFEKDPESKTSVIRFLIEAGFISKLELDLSGVDLSGVDLSRVDLSRVNLSDADLSNINLIHVNLSEADLNGANLSEANLGGTRLEDAFLIMANLSGAYLRDVNFSRACLSSANFSNSCLSDARFGRADLSGAIFNNANLSNARDLTVEQLEMAKLCHTRLPENITRDSKCPDPNRDCQALGISEN